MTPLIWTPFLTCWIIPSYRRTTSSNSTRAKKRLWPASIAKPAARFAAASKPDIKFHSTESPSELEKIWHLYRDCACRKQFRLERPLSFYVDLMRGAQLHNRARLYTVSHEGKTVGSTLAFRDRTTAHCLLAAFDVDHRHSAAFLHWRSMRDMYSLGAHRYNMGPGPGSLARFKGEFCQYPVHYPGPLTMVLKKDWFQLWRKAFVPMAKQLQPVLRKIAFQRAALSR